MKMAENWLRMLVCAICIAQMMCTSSARQQFAHKLTDVVDTGLVIHKVGLTMDPVTGKHSRWKRRVDPIHHSNRNEEEEEQKRKYKRLEHDIRIRGEIRSRYAMTLVENTVENSEEEAREVFFSVILPETAFISRFAMEIAGEVFLAEVREKEEAFKLYKDAVKEGKSAGHVGMTARHSNRFHVSVNTEAGTKVRFYLLYEELLQRKAGAYKYVINISPHQKLRFYSIDVNIGEQRNITRLSVPQLRSQFLSSFKAEEKEEGQVPKSESLQLEDAFARISPTEGNKASVTYYPDSKNLQEEIKEGLLQFIIEYDVDRTHIHRGGQIDLYQGHFVHFLAPPNLPPMPKHVVFVLDTSGSMKHRKMEQTVNAMKTILSEMRGHDYITIVRFSSNVSVWDLYENRIVEASAKKRRLAMQFVETLEASGSTNINAALEEALSILADVKRRKILPSNVQSMIFFLTDGHPTEGVTNATEILHNVRTANKEVNAAIYSLAFGVKTDLDMLRLLSVQNFGFARKIYTAADASLQLEGLYKELSSPVLSNVTFTYMDPNIIKESVTETVFHTFYDGGEMVVAGRLERDTVDKDQEINLDALLEYTISAHKADGEYKVSGNLGSSKAGIKQEMIPILSETVDAYVDVMPNVSIEYNFLERLWAYLSVRNLMDKLSRGELVSCHLPYTHPPLLDLEEEAGEPVERIPVICNNLERALYLSLKYQFVTPFTSLVVVKPDARENGDFGEADRYRRINISEGNSIHNSKQFLISFMILWRFLQFLSHY